MDLIVHVVWSIVSYIEAVQLTNVIKAKSCYFQELGYFEVGQSGHPTSLPTKNVNLYKLSVIFMYTMRAQNTQYSTARLESSLG